MRSLFQFLPDGKSFLFAKHRTGTVETWFARLDGKEPKLILSKASQAYYAPPGYLLYVQGDSLLAHRFDASRGVLIGDANTLVSGVASDSFAIGSFTVSATGVLVFRQGSVTNPSRLTWFDLASAAMPPARCWVKCPITPFQLFLLMASASQSEFAIPTVNAISGFLTSKEAPRLESPLNPPMRLTPSGRRTAPRSLTARTGRGHRDIYARPSAGTGQERVVFESDEDKSVEAWSPDGKFLAYTVLNPKTRRDVWLLAADDGQRAEAGAVSRHSGYGGPAQVLSR